MPFVSITRWQAIGLTQEVSEIQPLFGILVPQDPIISQDILDLGLEC